MDFIKSYGFSSVDTSASIKLDAIVETIVYNMLNNVLHVVDALNASTIKKGHFLGVMHVLKEAAKHCDGAPPSTKKKQQRQRQHGGTVMPPEFFGYDSGRFYADVDFHNTAYIDNLTRGGLDVASGGAAAAAKVKSKKSTAADPVSCAEIKEIVKKFKLEHNRENLKIAAEVYLLIQSVVSANLVKLIQACKKTAGKDGTLTGKMIFDSIKGSGAELAHLMYVWK